MQKGKDFIQCESFVFAGTVDFIDHCFTGTDIDRTVTDRKDTGILIDDQRSDVVFTRLLNIVEIGTRRDNVCHIAFDMRWFAFLFDQYDGVAFALDNTVEVAFDRDGGNTCKQGILYRIFEYRFVFACQLDIEQFGNLFRFSDLLFFIVDFIDFKKGADLYQNERIVPILFLIVSLQVKIDFG